MSPRLLASFLPAVLFLPSCNHLSYYTQAVAGQLDIFRKQRPIPDVLADPSSPEPLKERLRLVGEIRSFAADHLSLPGAKTHYTRYADLGRPFVVWNVFATQEFSLEPHSWWYPVVGSLDYRGFFDKDAATACAKSLADKGMDTALGGVAAYSTLGYFRDPVLNTFIDDPELNLAGLLFHELTHHRFFLKGDTSFSEGLATAVEEEGLRLWVKHRKSPDLERDFDIYLTRRRDFVSLIGRARADLETLYASSKRDTPAQIDATRKAKAAIFADLKSQFLTMKKTRWRGYSGYDKWFDRDLTHAHLNTVATYFDLVPGFKKLLRDSDHDFAAFFKSVESLAKLPGPERALRLDATN